MVRHFGRLKYDILMKKIIIIISLALVCFSCKKADVIGGTVNPTDRQDVTTYEFLMENEETAIVAQLFEAAGMKDLINDEVTLVAPSKYSVNRLIRRKNSANYRSPEEPRYTIDSLLQDTELLQKMAMYVFPGIYGFDNLSEVGTTLTSVDGSQDIILTVDETNTDPGPAYDGGKAAGAGFQYSNFLEKSPLMIHVLFKRGLQWETEYLERDRLKLDDPECDHHYRMYVSNVRTKNGMVHIVYSGDTSFNEHYYYHSLFFFGTRADDK